MGRKLFITMLMMWTLLFAGRLMHMLGHEVSPLDWALLGGVVCGLVATLALRARSRRNEDG